MYNYRNSNKTPFFCKKINNTLLPIGLSAGQIGNSQVATLQRLAMRDLDYHKLIYIVSSHLKYFLTDIFTERLNFITVAMYHLKSTSYHYIYSM